MPIRTIEEARAWREALTTLTEGMDDTAALGAVELYPAWLPGQAYAAGHRRRYGDLLYRCLLAHTSQADWSPDVAPSLWVRIDDPAIEWPEWVQPTGAHDAYPLGAKVSHNGARWVSSVAANVWEPGAYGWDKQA